MAGWSTPGSCSPPYGTLAERMAVPATMKLPRPYGAEPERVAGGLNPGLSSWLPLRNQQSEAGAPPPPLARGMLVRVLTGLGDACRGRR
jgi:hypothetical protein